MAKRYCVNFEFNCSGGSVIVEAESKADAERFVRKNMNFNLGELENNESLCDTEKSYVHATLLDKEG